MENIGGTETTGKRRRLNGAGKEPVTGRKDGDGQEAVIDKGALLNGMPKAIKLEKEMSDMKADASAFYKQFAKESGFNAAQLRAAAKSYANEDVELARRKAKQTTLIFEECGEQ